MWKKYRLSDIGTIVGGATPPTTVEKYYGGDIPWLTPKDLSSFNERYITKGERNITEDGLKSCSVQLLPKGSVLFSSRAPIGYVAIADNPIATNQGFKSIIPNKNINSLFLYYLLKFNKANIESMGSGTTFKEVSGATMKNIEVMLPPLEKQERIARILGALDDKIELNNGMNRNLEEQAQTLFRQWFVNSEKKAWREIDLGSVVETTSGGTPSRLNSGYYENGTIYWVKSKELNGSFIINTEEKITEDAVKKSSAKILPANSILIAMYGATVGEYGIISKEMTCNQAVCALIPNKEYPYTFLLNFVKYNKDRMINLAVGSAQQNISQQLIKSLQIIDCTDKIQEFHTITESLYQQIKKNIEENQTLSTLRDTLLPRLMNKEIKL